MLTVRQFDTNRAPVLPLERLSWQIAEWRREGLRVANCHGRFDPLHVGHLFHFEEAKSLADRLVVTVTPDRFSRSGPERPIVPEELRAAMISGLRCVDAVAINIWPHALELLEMLRPDLFVKGVDYADNPDPAFEAEVRKAAELGIVVHTTRTEKHSSTELFDAVR